MLHVVAHGVTDMGMEKSERRGIVLFFAAAFLGLCAWAFPNMSRLVTISAAIFCLTLAIIFLWPEIKFVTLWPFRALGT